MKGLVLVPTMADIDPVRFQEKVGVYVSVNTLPREEPSIAVYDARHESSLPERGWSFVAVVGDSLSKLAKQSDYIGPTNRQDLLEAYVLGQLEAEQETEEEQEGMNVD